MKIVAATSTIALLLVCVDGFSLRGRGHQEASSLMEDPVTAAATDEPCTCGNGKAKIWGPGGPQTALVPAANLFNEQRADGQPEIEICWGPEHTWRDSASECSAGLMAAAEEQAAGFIRVYNDIIDTTKPYGSISTTLTMHGSTLLVAKGNPKGINNLEDLLERDDVGIVVVDGNYHDTLTSGTALYEDVIGRTKQMDDTVAFKDRICHVAGGAGEARNQLLATDNKCDAWVYWNDWAIANDDIIEDIGLPDALKIYRGLSVISTTNEGGDAVEDFVDFVLTSKEANEAMEEAGWQRDFE